MVEKQRNEKQNSARNRGFDLSGRYDEVYIKSIWVQKDEQSGKWKVTKE